ncbi:MFS transporter [Candidatus Dojkabacteria bacterium]|nr:MFS transporter [Candidatus Dojkabacteria bacterium]
MSNSLPRKVKRLVFSHGLFLVGKRTFNIFMTIYIWELTKDVQVLAIAAIIRMIFHTSMFFIFANIIKQGKGNIIRMIGLAGYMVVYVVIFFLKDNLVDYLYILSAFQASFNGMYWVAYHVSRFDITDKDNRGNYTGVEKAAKIIVSLVIPVVGGYIVTQNFFGNGFSLLFLIACFFLMGSLYIGNIGYETKKSKLRFRETWKLVTANGKILRGFLANTLSGLSINAALAEVVIPLLIIERAQTEFEFGSWLSLFALISIVTTLLVGKFVKYNKYDEMLVIGAGLFILSYLGFIAWPTYFLVLVFAGVKEVVVHFIDIPRRVYTENLLETLDVDISKYRVEYLIIREFFNVGLGYTLSYVILLFVADVSAGELYFFSVFIILGLVGQVLLLLSIRFKNFLKV